MAMRYDAVVFDLFGTLVDNFSRREYEHVLSEMADALGVARQAFADAWLATFDEQAVGLLASVEANVAHCLQTMDTAVDSASLDAAVAVRMGLTERALVPRPGAVETLCSLRAADPLGWLIHR
jgi:putative hydrolase of the HAD superfamily